MPSDGPMICERLRLAYFPVPKVANTSVKYILYEAEYGHKFEPRVDPRSQATLHIHKVFPTPYWSEDFVGMTSGYTRLCLVRDPLERLVSAYRNRVVHHRELSPHKVNVERLQELGLAPDPTLEQFVENLEGYRAACKSIKKHTDPLVAFLGEDPRLYDLVLRIDELARIQSLCVALGAAPPTISWMQKGGPAMTKQMLSDSQRERLRVFYAKDYEVFGAHL